ncbi:unnamed protein product [Ceutorhynchus assimilis]|uniref:Uncharacterized protein n=1 Tax=Ceutorhynchus assimilis TaxID=467358 RepID=A0A9N9ME29_9CUCU|nr:unnamed protein product [Ceutorhynchus assimilis]
MERRVKHQENTIRSYEKQIADLSAQVARQEQLKQTTREQEQCNTEMKQIRDLCQKDKDTLKNELNSIEMSYSDRYQESSLSSSEEEEVTFLLRLKPSPTPPTRRRKNIIQPQANVITTPKGWDVVIERRDPEISCANSSSSCSSPVKQQRFSFDKKNRRECAQQDEKNKEEIPPPIPPRFKPSAPPPEPIENNYGWPPINQSTACRVLKKIRETGSAEEAARSGRPKTVTGEDKALDMMLSIQETLTQSSRTLALAMDFNVSHQSVKNLFKKQKLHPYKMKLVHELNEDDLIEELNFVS